MRFGLSQFPEHHFPDETDHVEGVYPRIFFPGGSPDRVGRPGVPHSSLVFVRRTRSIHLQKNIVVKSVANPHADECAFVDLEPAASLLSSFGRSLT
jgi:hypothetical protein